MSISRSPKDPEHPYTKASNSFIYDCRLSLKSKALLLFVLSKPPTWVFNFRDVLRFNSDGIRSVRNSIKELSSFGYLFVSQFHRPNGDFDYSSFSFFETYKNLSTIKTVTPAHSPFAYTRKAHTRKACTRNSNTSNSKNKKLLRKETTTTPTKVDNTTSAVASLEYLQKELDAIKYLTSIKIIDPKHLFAKYGFNTILKHAKYFKKGIITARNPTGLLIRSIQEKWFISPDKNSPHPLLQIDRFCDVCGKWFCYQDFKKTRKICNKCIKKGK